MLKRDTLDQLAEQIGSLLGNQSLSADLQRNVRALLQSGLAHLDVVTRDEFEAQAAVLAQTRTKLEQLEAQLQELAAQLNPPPG